MRRLLMPAHRNGTLEFAKIVAALFFGDSPQYRHHFCDGLFLGLMASVYQGKESDDDLAGIRKALAKGADINCRDLLTWTPLMYAAYGGFPKIARFLIENGARQDLEITERGGLQNWKGYTAPKIAAYYLQKNKDLLGICKPERREEYTRTIAKYQELVDMLQR
ncbi:MAG: hypothetical protein C0514_01670 [Candidatus Puniceispirillum sp.]|nr:hypothetical protein [Candidatus Puniceispirillum sp.]